jgi:hypothetical protein
VQLNDLEEDQRMGTDDCDEFRAFLEMEARMKKKQEAARIKAIAEAS